MVLRVVCATWAQKHYSFSSHGGITGVSRIIRGDLIPCEVGSVAAPVQTASDDLPSISDASTLTLFLPWTRITWTESTDLVDQSDKI